MNPNNLQATQNQEAGQAEQVADIDYDAVYGGLDIDTTPPPMTPAMKKSWAHVLAENSIEIAADVGKQLSKEILIGAGGTYGDLAELVGVKKEFPGQDVRSRRESDVLNKMEEPGYQPALQDLTVLESEDDLMPSGTLPSSKTLRDLNDMAGGIGKPQTKTGEYAQRVGQFYGAGLPFLQVNPVPALAAGVAGQATEDLGGGTLAQVGAEIAGLIAGGWKKGSAAQKKIQDKVKQLKDAGFTDQDITLAINSGSKGKKFGVKASKSATTEKMFEESAQRSDNLISEILESEIPGFSKGPKAIHEKASEAYGKVAEEASNIIIKDAKPFTDSVAKVNQELRKTLGRNPDAESFLKRINEAAEDATKSPTAESFMNFFKELNSMGNWMGRSQKDRIITQVKNGIKDTFKAQGKEGREFAEKFDKANQGIRKAYRAEEVSELIQKSTTQDGIDYKKFNKQFDKLENIELFEEVLGARQARNLKLISNTGKEIADFDKSWKTTTSMPEFVENSVAGLGSLYYIVHGDWEGLAKTLAIKNTAQAGRVISKKIAEIYLRSPKFQALNIRALHALKNESPKALKSAIEAMKKYFDDQGIDID